MSDNPLDAYRFDPETIVHRTPEHATRDDIVVMSLDFNADPLERMAWMRATARSASCSSLSHSTTLTGSPSPRSDHSVLGKSLGLSWMTLLAARRMALVER